MIAVYYQGKSNWSKIYKFIANSVLLTQQTSSPSHAYLTNNQDFFKDRTFFHHDNFALWTSDDPSDHHTKPDSYQLTWWPGNRADSDINSGSTTGKRWHSDIEIVFNKYPFKHFSNKISNTYSNKFWNIYKDFMMFLLVKP